MADKLYSLQEIQQQIKDLYSKTENDWMSLLGGLRSDNPDQKESPYKSMSFESAQDVYSKIDQFLAKYEGKLEILRQDATRIDKTPLSAEQWKELDNVSKQLSELETFFNSAKQEQKEIKSFEDEKIMAIIDNPHANHTKLPQQMSSATSHKFLRQIQTYATKHPNADTKRLAGLILFIYLKSENKDKLVPTLQDITKDPQSKNLIKAIRENMDQIMSAKAFSDEDKATLKDIFEKKSLLSQIFRKAAANLKQKQNNTNMLSNGNER